MAQCLSGFDWSCVPTEGPWAGGPRSTVGQPSRRIKPDKRFVRNKGYTQVAWAPAAHGPGERYGMYTLFDTSSEDRSDFLHGYDSTVHGRPTGQGPSPGMGGLTADAIVGMKVSGRDYTPSERRKNIEFAYAGGETTYQLGAGTQRGYDLYWRPGTYHKRSDDLVRELDHSMLDNLRYVNPLAGPLSPIPPDAKHPEDFTTGCDTKGKCPSSRSPLAARFCANSAKAAFVGDDSEGFFGCSTSCGPLSNAANPPMPGSGSQVPLQSMRQCEVSCQK